MFANIFSAAEDSFPWWNSEEVISDEEFKIEIDDILTENDIIRVDQTQLDSIMSCLKYPSIELEKLDLRPSDIIVVRDFSKATDIDLYNLDCIDNIKIEVTSDDDDIKDKAFITGDYNVARACDLCNQIFDDEDLFRKHQKMHKKSKSTRYIEGEKTSKNGYRCNLCNQTFSAGYTLKKHIRVHTREKPFSCDFCHERFSQWGNLRLHIQRHLGINPYRCPYCDKAYIAPSKLEVHIRGHTNERPYPCEVCYATFKSNDDLRKHMMIHANYKPFTCWLCQKSFMQPSKLKQHMKEKHYLDVDISKKDVTDRGVEYEIKILSET